MPGHWPRNSSTRISSPHSSATSTFTNWHSTFSPSVMAQSLPHSTVSQPLGGQDPSQIGFYPTAPSMVAYPPISQKPSIVSQSLSHSAAFQHGGQALPQLALSTSAQSMGSYDTFVNLPEYNTRVSSPGQIQNNNEVFSITLTDVEAGDRDVEMTDILDFAAGSQATNETYNATWVLGPNPSSVCLNGYLDSLTNQGTFPTGLEVTVLVPDNDVEMIDAMEWESQVPEVEAPYDLMDIDPMDIDERDSMDVDAPEPQLPSSTGFYAQYDACKQSGMLIEPSQHPAMLTPLNWSSCPELQVGATSDTAMGSTEIAASILQRKCKFPSIS